MRKNARKLGVITGELQSAMKAETTSIIAIGNLLIEAQEQLDHGEWLPWLAANFSSSISTAQNYMRAANFAAKFPTVANLKLRPSALYWLGYYNQNVIEAALKEAETKWVTDDCVREIERALRPKLELESAPAKTEAEIEAEKKEQTEIDTILAGLPPELPPAPEPAAPDLFTPPFDQAIKTLRALQTKPLNKFTSTAHKRGDIRAVRDFLHEVADLIDR